jgi:1,4-alpha-glucan branching enzyme
MRCPSKRRLPAQQTISGEVPRVRTVGPVIHASRPKPARLEKVCFDWEFPQAKKVFIAGSFNNWESAATPLKNCGGGCWRLELDLLPGRYEYGFFVDDRWVNDPSVTGRGSATHNCVLIVTASPERDVETSRAEVMEER